MSTCGQWYLYTLQFLISQFTAQPFPCFKLHIAPCLTSFSLPLPLLLHSLIHKIHRTIEWGHLHLSISWANLYLSSYVFFLSFAWYFLWAVIILTFVVLLANCHYQPWFRALLKWWNRGIIVCIENVLGALFVLGMSPNCSILFIHDCPSYCVYNIGELGNNFQCICAVTWILLAVNGWFHHFGWITSWVARLKVGLLYQAFLIIWFVFVNEIIWKLVAVLFGGFQKKGLQFKGGCSILNIDSHVWSLLLLIFDVLLSLCVQIYHCI